MNELHEKINFGTVRQKSFLIFSVIILLQFFYVTSLTLLEWKNVIALFFISLLGYVFLWMISRGSKSWVVCRFKHKLFTFLFFTSFISTVFFSRYEYITSTATQGLAATRLDESLGSGGWYSLLNSLFYPLALLSVFHKKRCWEYHAFFYLTILMCGIDIIFMGTRNSIFFVMFFRFLFAEVSFLKKNRSRFYFSLAAIGGVFFAAFEYTTRERSGFVGDDFDYWFEKAIYSVAMESSTLNVELYRSFADISHLFLPLFYLIGYVSHSIPEFLRFIENFDQWSGTLAHLRLYISAFTFQDVDYLGEYVSVLRYRSGYYQTLYASLIVDFGLFVIFLPILLVVISGGNKFLVVKIYLIPVLILSTIENYLYTGLTPLRFALFIVFGLYFLSNKSAKILKAGYLKSIK